MKVALLICLSIVCGSLSKQIGPLPDYQGPEITQTTGYITIDETTGDNRFYWLVESSGNPDTDPLIFWFQGGPGCSGLIGLFTENGPYRPLLFDNGTQGVAFNDISWTTFANILYLEQPTGVGYSYSDTPSDYVTNDTKAALDNFKFVELWLNEFPQYKGRKTWFSGESYGGVYIPTLASVVLNNPDSQIAQQLAGLTLGNPVISCASVDYNAVQFDLFYWHGLVSHSIYTQWYQTGCNLDSSTYDCNVLMNITQNEIGYIFQEKRDADDTVQPSLDPDDLYQDFCTGNGTLDFAVNEGYPSQCYPVGLQMSDYLNRADVQAFIGAKSVMWNECAGYGFNYTTLGNSMIPNYQQVFASSNNISVMVYSGDVDIATVPFGITAACLEELSEDQEERKAWGPWFVNGATAGYYEQYAYYTYATIKGAGHESPQYQPLTAFNAAKRFITTGTLEGGRPPRWNYRVTQARTLKSYGIQG